MTPVALFLIAVAVLLACTFVCALAEGVVLGLRRGESDPRAELDGGISRLLQRYRRDLRAPLAALFLLHTVVLGAGGLAVGWSYGRAVGPGSPWLLLLAGALVLLLVHAAAGAVGAASVGRLAAPVARALGALTWLLGPLVAAKGSGPRRATASGSLPPADALIEEIERAAALEQSSDSVGPRVAQFMAGAASLRELKVHDVMVPRGGVAFLSGVRSLDENLETIRVSGHSRFPFTVSADLDDVEGIVLAKELLFRVRDGRASVDWSELVSPLLVVPETKPLDQVLRMFQDQRKHLAVVVDEYGGTQGVLTLEDVLEEIVGEIEDETDRVEQAIVKRADGSLACRGWAETRKVFRVLGVDERAEAVTIGGFVADLLGRVPRADDVASWKGLRFRVLKASARRAERVEVTLEPAEDGADEPAGRHAAS